MQEETVLQELISCRVEHYRNNHKIYRPDDALCNNEQEREEVEFLLNKQSSFYSRHDPLIVTLHASETCSCTLRCECNRQFYWYYHCYLLDECSCRENCLTALPCRHIYCKHAYYPLFYDNRVKKKPESLINGIKRICIFL